MTPLAMSVRGSVRRPARRTPLLGDRLGEVEAQGTVAATHASGVSLSLDESVQLRIRDVVPDGTARDEGTDAGSL